MAASALVALVLLVPLFFQLLRRLAQRWRGDARAWREASSDLNRAIVMAAFLPHQAYLALDAIIRACYRLGSASATCWSGRPRKCRTWRPFRIWMLSARSSSSSPRWRPRFCWRWIFGAFFGNRHGRLFCCSGLPLPAVQHWIGWQRRAVRKLEQIEVDDQRYLRRIARETWRYFDDLVGPEHNWLPPDNSQEALRVEIADRTSPTNIGMWLMSAVSARDLGFLTPEQMVDRCSATMETLEKLERCEGHILNWYNTRTLEPLAAQVCIDSRQRKPYRQPVGACSRPLRRLEAQPQLEARALRGLADTLAVIMERFPPDHTTAVPLEALRGCSRKNRPASKSWSESGWLPSRHAN